jgi:hypothetical protein
MLYNGFARPKIKVKKAFKIENSGIPVKNRLTATISRKHPARPLPPPHLCIIKQKTNKQIGDTLCMRTI